MRLCEEHDFAFLDAAPFISAQPIWAELLTGEPWFKNGCAGYSRPAGSLNKVEVVSEEHLLRPVNLLRDRRSIVINVPLLRPDNRTRIWLSDGSSPSGHIVSPERLREDEPFSSYEPRPYSSIIEMLSSPRKAIAKCLEIEMKRLVCAQALLRKEDWEICIFRSLLFDQLVHLFGPAEYTQKNLQVSEAIRSYTSSLDDTLSWYIQRPGQFDVWLLSCFSHASCKRRLSLNGILRDGGFLTDARKESSHPALSVWSRREEVAAAFSGFNGASVPDRVTWSEGMLATERTSAASPMAGCIFINDEQRFADGNVKLDQFQSTLTEVSNFLRERLMDAAGQNVSVVVNPNSHLHLPGLPDIIVQADGIEFVDVEDPKMDAFSTPQSTHAAHGFVFFPPSLTQCPDTISSVGLHQSIANS